MKKINVFICDDHSLVRDGIASMLYPLNDFQVVGEADNGLDALEKIKSNTPDVILMDIMMPGMNGIEALKEIKKFDDKIKVIMLSMELSEEFISEAIKEGASGYLPKDIRKQVLMDAIKEVYEGGTYFSDKISKIVFDEFYRKSTAAKSSSAPLPGVGKISDREMEVLKLIASGYSNNEIADKLFISVRTVDSHRTHIMIKLELKSTADLVRYAIKHNLVEL